MEVEKTLIFWPKCPEVKKNFPVASTHAKGKHLDDFM
jgi:hypothetical protein